MWLARVGQPTTQPFKFVCLLGRQFIAGEAETFLWLLKVGMQPKGTFYGW